MLLSFPGTSLVFHLGINIIGEFENSEFATANSYKGIKLLF